MGVLSSVCSGATIVCDQVQGSVGKRYFIPTANRRLPDQWLSRKKLLAAINVRTVSGSAVAMVDIAPTSRMISSRAAVDISVLFKNDRWSWTGHDDRRRCFNDNGSWFLSDDSRGCRSAHRRLLHFVDYQLADAVLVQGDNLGDTNLLLDAAGVNLIDDQLWADAAVRQSNRVLDRHRFL